MAYADPQRAKEYRREWEKRNREKRLAQQREWRAALPEERRQKYNAESYARNRDKVLARNRAWENANRARRNEYARAKYRENAEHRRLQAASRKYGLPVDEIRALRDGQFNRCGICSAEFDARTSPCVDHDHKTGRVRGLLCKHCNFAVGHLRDEPALALSAAVYLRATEAAN